MDYRIAIIGDAESVVGFMAVGFSVFPADDEETASRTLFKIAKENYAVIYITEDLAKKMPEAIARYKDVPIPAVIVIPGRRGSDGYGLFNVKKSVERAVGADILFKD